MRTYLLPEQGRFYKANLHCHTTMSDGKWTPEQMKERYRERGYSILAVSDHEVLRSHYHLTEDDFLVLTAYEISIRNDDDVTPHAYRKVVDLNLFAKDPHNLTQVSYHPDTVAWLVQRGKLESADQIKYAGDLRDMHYYPANVNKIIKSANENGFLVSINHPMWSLMNYNDYATFEGAWAVEVYNHGCHAVSGLGDSENVLDDILRTGKSIFAIATDDNHNHKIIGYPSEDVDSFGGFTMIKSESLDYASVIQAMEKGHFYASTGPQIESLYYEDGYVHLTCSEASEVCMTTLGRRGARVCNMDGTPVTSAVFRIDPELYGYVRFRVTDKNGNKAYTNAYYVHDFVPDARARRVIL